MKKILFVCLLMVSVVSLNAAGQVHVKGYYRNNGTYVAPHVRSAPNNTIFDNYSYQGNKNVGYTSYPLYSNKGGFYGADINMMSFRSTPQMTADFARRYGLSTYTSTIQQNYLVEPVRPKTQEEIKAMENETIKNRIKCANEGLPTFQYELGMNYLNGTDGFTTNTTIGVNWLTAAATNGNSQAKKILESLKKSSELEVSK